MYFMTITQQLLNTFYENISTYNSIYFSNLFYKSVYADIYL